jgi:hypothetical protein
VIGGGAALRTAAVLRDKVKGRSKEGEVFFSGEKKQKTFVRCRAALRQHTHREQKFFGSFFQKRTLSYRRADIDRLA